MLQSGLLGNLVSCDFIKEKPTAIERHGRFGVPTARRGTDSLVPPAYVSPMEVTSVEEVAAFRHSSYLSRRSGEEGTAVRFCFGMIKRLGEGYCLCWNRCPPGTIHGTD
jgi:hypothetical protein